MLTDWEFDLSQREKYLQQTEELNESTYKVIEDFDANCPDADDIERSMAFNIARIPQLDAKYKMLLAKSSAELDKVKVIHARITNMCRKFHLRDRSIDVEDYARFGWNWDNNVAVMRADLEYVVPADPTYAACTMLLAAHQRRVDMLKENLKVLTERGRQYKTAVEYLRFTNGG